MSAEFTTCAQAVGALAGPGGASSLDGDAAVAMTAATGAVPRDDAGLLHLVRMVRGSLEAAGAPTRAKQRATYAAEAARLADQFDDALRLKADVRQGLLSLACKIVAAGEVSVDRTAAEAAIDQAYSAATCIGHANVAPGLIVERVAAMDALAKRWGFKSAARMTVRPELLPQQEGLGLPRIPDGRLTELFLDLRRFEQALAGGLEAAA